MNLSIVHERAVEIQSDHVVKLDMAEIRKREVAERLEILRAALGLTQEEIAREIGYDDKPGWANVVSLTQKVIINVVDANRLCDKHGASLDWIYRGIESGLTVGCNAAVAHVRDRMAKGEKLASIGRSNQKLRAAAAAGMARKRQVHRR